MRDDWVDPSPPLPPPPYDPTPGRGGSFRSVFVGTCSQSISIPWKIKERKQELNSRVWITRHHPSRAETKRCKTQEGTFVLSTALPLLDWRRGARALGLWSLERSEPCRTRPRIPLPSSWSWQGVPIRGVGAGGAGTAFSVTGVVMLPVGRGMVEMGWEDQMPMTWSSVRRAQFSICEDA